MKYQAKGSVNALRIIEKSRHVVEDFYCVLVETFPGCVSRVGCTASKKPRMGDYVIFQDMTDNYCCPADVFEEKYELLE